MKNFLCAFCYRMVLRAYKLSVVQLDSSSILRSKHATGKMRWKTANWRTRSARQNHCFTPTNHCVKMVCWPVVMANVLNVVCSVMVIKTVMTAPMKTVAVSDNRVSFWWLFLLLFLFFCCFFFGRWKWKFYQTRSIVYSLIMQNSPQKKQYVSLCCLLLLSLFSVGLLSTISCEIYGLKFCEQ